jgi:hypothetical protein
VLLKSLRLSISFVGLLLVAASAWAGTSALEGVVKSAKIHRVWIASETGTLIGGPGQWVDVPVDPVDPTGQPVKGADVRIEATNGGNFSRIVKTDATGHYTSDRLAVGIYKVTLLVNGAVKASILNAYTQSGKPTQLNFELTPKTKSVKTHKVWIAPATGTLIGGGQWVDVDDNGNVVNNSGVSSVEKSSAMETNLFRARPRSPGGQ